MIMVYDLDSKKDLYLPSLITEQTMMPLSLLLPFEVTVLRLIAAMVITVIITGTVYVTVYNYWQDITMKTKHKRSRISRLAKIRDRRTELEKFKQFGENDENDE